MGANYIADKNGDFELRIIIKTVPDGPVYLERPVYLDEDKMEVVIEKGRER